MTTCQSRIPGSRNLATEDIVDMFEKSGTHTGIDLEKLVSVDWWMTRAGLAGWELGRVCTVSKSKKKKS